MPKYRVEVHYKIDRSDIHETHEFEAEDDEAAWRYIEESTGNIPRCIKRDGQLRILTLNRVSASPSS